ncbi:chromosome segregation protein SMC [Clostridium septicum]|uniref:Chromosome partition protein Smc n=1 Tax=Clostridium septicum TaxID=1504 RepID=A0A9N7JJT2_CLOSE|nr:chromosome segregation protein SMC [Clostridium septicum]AYE33097.1 chromosome segregation protein SMC [Clostridium septicum]MDU1313495.1 chromosome segregation protein SMC [Clostridium septicum]QAS61267.1 chromosome segregation protein SMC [Clostridium septicum]UEC19382.1 chromosome segregation protein SMC [Clostridium septicum]USR99665.1 chromosome segregation protein SMC [Clostridium septicum]
MFLKSLEIRGFKSFADKTELKFKEGVTAVVGPNGSGKSNISDSVRWVLGEQSVKTLRGGKMEDVIFAGTQFRKPVGLAQVSLTLDNSDNSLDTEYTEVTITRRIFRSGETEYLINNKKCRLKDINLLFMDTGIGKEGYSLIGQGKIEAILSGKPEERRALLEEAAGIVKFKSRKEEAEKKLSNTENNLIRIRDIISTYEERVGPLKEEREKAIKYKALAEELKIKEVSILTYYIEKIEEEIKNINKDIIERKKEIEEKRLKLYNYKEELSNLEKSLENLENKNESEKREYYSKKEELSQSINDIEIFKERIKNLNDSIDRDKFNLKELEESLVKSLDEKDNLLKSLEEKIKEQQEKEKEIHNLENKIGELNSEIKKITDELKELKEDEFEVLRKISEIKNSIAILNKDIISKKQLNVTGEGTLKTIEGNISINIATVKELKENIDISIRERKNIQNEILNNKKKIAILNSNLSKKEAIIRNITKDTNTLEGKLTTLRDLEKSYEGYQMSVKRLMERIESGKINEAKGTKVLGEVFTVEKKYETAIEISLGGAISNIITKNENTAKFLIEYLKKNNLGRATFLPVNIIKGNRIFLSKEIETLDGYVGIASDIIKFDPLFKDIMDYCLGKTIIAKDMDSALEISKIGKHKVKIVTLSGEVISPGGALTGGSIYKKNNSSILGRRRELSELQELISKNKEIYNKEIEKLEEIKREVKALDDENLNKSDEVHSKTIDITKFESEIKALKNEEIKLKNSLEISKKEILFNKDTLNKLEEEILNKKNKLEFLEDKNTKNKDKAINLELALNEKNIIVENSKECCVKLKIEKATLDESLQGKYSEIKRKEREEKEKREKIVALELESKAKEENIVYLDKQIKVKNELIEEFKKRIDILDEVFKAYEIEKISLKDKSKIKEGLINELVDIIRVEENELNKKEIINAKSESERDSYYKKLNEELNLTLAEALEIAFKITSVSQVKDEIFSIKSNITSLGTVNLAAIAEYEEVIEKYEFMSTQEEDLNKAKAELLGVINEMTAKMQELFKDNFKILNENFNETFNELFKGGNAELILSDGDELTANIDINVQPPGKKLQNINLMSGGEKVLSAIALLFAILKMKPTPFCILDEIEAALDDANVYRYAEFLKKFSENIQFIVITHRKGTMEASDIMYGVTMEEKGISKVVSVDLTKNN